MSQSQQSEQQRGAAPRPQERGGRLQAEAASTAETGEGHTTIADAVVTKIANVAAREVAGVYDLGGGRERAVGAVTGAVRERVPGSRGPTTTRGVSVEVGERQAAIDLTVVADYGVAIQDLARGVRRNVTNAIERMTGLEVVEVNVEVVDVNIPGEQEEAPEPTRVE